MADHITLFQDVLLQIKRWTMLNTLYIAIKIMTRNFKNMQSYINKNHGMVHILFTNENYALLHLGIVHVHK